MAQGTIPIFEVTGSKVGKIVYIGTPASGVWVFEPEKRFKGAAFDALIKRVAIAKRTHSDLKNIRFMAEGFTRSNGWQGYWGLLGALEHALPTVGLKIDRNDIDPVRLAQPISYEYDLRETPEGETP